jgi:hypothetical protein
MGEKRNTYRLLVGKPEGQRPLGRPKPRWVDDIRMDLGEVDGLMWTGLVWLRRGTGGSSEFGIETSGSIKCCETIEWPNSRWPLE